MSICEICGSSLLRFLVRSLRPWSARSLFILGVLCALCGQSLFVACANAQGYAPDEAVRRMTVAAGFEVQLVAAEPLVRQPVAIEFDDRGRLWVVQYLQYPNPAGLQRVKVDRYSRTQYDRLPEPPPRGPRGEDRLTILEDTDGDGRADRAKDFVTGLNLASGLAFGHGGVFVLNAPYLLFYADHDRNDVPDGDPEVLLTGFGIEDAHSVANSLTWGPDGWLYGTQGSTVTAQIRGIEFQQGVWRYHSVTRRFELFCEGGGNSWGLDFDRHGELLYSTNLGGHVLLHGVQGAYYWKSFGKHGALHNPHAYGYFDHAPHANFNGGHVTVGGIVYQADLFPPQFRDRYIAADLLGHGVNWHEISPRGSTFRTAHGGALLTANDSWFAPSDVTVGPDGAVYVADWHDARTAHPDPDATWDRTNGRIYRIAPRGSVLSPPRDLHAATDEELRAELSSTNEWYARRASRLLAERSANKLNETLVDQLTKDVFVSPSPLAREAVLDCPSPLAGEGGVRGSPTPPLRALWALYGMTGLDEPLALRLLTHKDEYVRAWTVRLLGDKCDVTAPIAKQFAKMAASDESLAVRRQLACTAKRLSATDGLPIVLSLTKRDDASDPHIPLLIWWAIEQVALPTRDELVRQLPTPQLISSAIVRETLLPRLVRRYASEADNASALACLELILSAPDAETRHTLLTALDEGLRSRAITEESPTVLAELATSVWRENRDDPLLARLAARLGNGEVQDHLVAQACDQTAEERHRLAALDVLAEVATPAALARIAPLLTNAAGPPLQSAVLRALRRGADTTLADAILGAYDKMSPSLRSQARDVLLSKASWARLLLARVATGAISPADVPVEQLRIVASHNDSGLDALVREHWGAIHVATAEERLAVARRLNNDLRAAAGDAASGHALFRKHCGTCHALLGEGEKIGPDLTHANRQDRDYLLASIVDPSSVVRKEYAAYTVQTRDGRVLSGLITEQDAGNVTLVTAKNERLRLARNDIETLSESPQSLMPDNIAEQLAPQEVRDLFAWLQQPAPPTTSTKTKP